MRVNILRNLSKKKIFILSLIIVFIILIIWTIWGNTALELNTYTISSDKITQCFNGFTIAQVSDLHNTEIGENNETLISILKSVEPDIIAITGDIIDASKTNTEIALQFAEEAVEIAPCYFITGNHEANISSSVYYEFENKLIKIGVRVLHNEEIIIEKDGEQISLIGIDDPYFSKTGDLASEKINELSTTSNFTVLLSHRPEYFEQYVESDVDLVLSGHAHGGQFRLPFIGGVVAPGQGLFPEYDAGVFTEDNTDMIVSRGIGNSIIPIRFNNRPEIVLIELQSQ